MTIYYGKIRQTKLETSNVSFDNFINSYKIPKIDNIPFEKTQRTNWKRRNMLCVISGELKDGKRNDANMIGRNVIAIDLDYIGVSTYQEIVEFLEKNFKYQAWLYPTISCTASRLRYRLVIPVQGLIKDKVIYQNVIEYFSRDFVDKGLLKGIDNSNKTWSQLFGLPIITQYTPLENVAHPLYQLKNKELLTVEKCHELNNIFKSIYSKPETQASFELASSYLTRNNDYHELVSNFAKEHREWLSDYNNYLACQFEIKYAEVKKHEINHNEALELVALLASDDFTARENQKKYELEKNVKEKGKGMAYFVSKKQTRSFLEWLQVDDVTGKYKIDYQKLVQKVFDKTHYFKSPYLSNKSAIYYRNEWILYNAETILKKEITAELNKSGLWNSRAYHNALTFADIQSFDLYGDYFNRSNPYLVQFDNKTINVKTFEIDDKHYDDYLPTNHKMNLHPEYLDKNRRLKKNEYPVLTLKWLQELIQDDDTIKYLLTLIGYCFCRTYNDSSVVTILLGSGNNGKSTLLRYISDLIGYENLASATLQQLGDNNLRFITAELYQKEANIFGDTGGNVIHNFDKIKSLSGGDSLLAEFKGEKPFTFTNYAKLIFSTNSLPKINDFSVAMKRRFKIIELKRNFDNETIKRFKIKYPLAKIYAEKEKMALLCLQYFHDFLSGERNLLKGSQEMQDLLDKWIDKNDTYGSFIKNYITNKKPSCLDDTKQGESLKNLYAGYKIINNFYDIKSITRKSFFNAFPFDTNKFKGFSGTSINTQRLENIFFTPKFFEDLSMIEEETGVELDINKKDLTLYNEWKNYKYK